MPILAFLSNLSQIQFLSLPSKSISDDGVRLIVDSVPQLTELTIGGRGTFTDSATESKSDACKISRS